METPTAFSAQKAEKPQKLRFLPVEKIFEISSSLSRLVTDPESRKLLARRMRNYAYTKRRGKLRLPAHLSEKVSDLLDLPKWRIREILYWVRPSTSLNFPLKQREFQFVMQHSAVTMWNRESGADSHMAHLVGLNRLGKSDAPSKMGRGLWPSSPSFSEMMEMSRKRVLHDAGHKNSPRVTVEHCLTRRDLSDDIRLASRVVAKNIVGIRSSVELPEDFLPWFRYRDGFSILTTRYSIPAGLVRFLLAQWKIRPTNLWLVDHCSLKWYLRKHKAVDFGITKVDAACSVETDSVSSEGPGVSSPSTIGPRLMSDEDLIAGLGDEFAELIAGLPG